MAAVRVHATFGRAGSSPRLDRPDVEEAPATAPVSRRVRFAFAVGAAAAAAYRAADGTPSAARPTPTTTSGSGSARGRPTDRASPRAFPFPAVLGERSALALRFPTVLADQLVIAWLREPACAEF